MDTNCLSRYLWAKTETLNMEVVRKKCHKDYDLTPGCGGLRRRVEIFQEKEFLDRFVAALMLRKGAILRQSTWVIGGDGRYFFKEALFEAIAVMAGYKVGNIVTAKDGILTTPAMSLLVKKLKATGGIMFTASHMPAGPKGYFGVKYVVDDGSTASDSELQAVCDIAKSLTTFLYSKGAVFPLDQITSYNFGIEEHTMSVTVTNAVRMYADYLQAIFDYGRIRDLLCGDQVVGIPVRVLVDCMHGASGPFAKEVMEFDLRAAEGTVINGEPKETYPTGFPSPRNSKGLVQGLRGGNQEIGFAIDTDGGRVMVMGRGAYQVYPGDSVAVIADHLHCIPYFQLNGVRGYARSVLTSKALDRVADAQKKPLHELPIGWSFFCNLIKQSTISFCGDNEYGLGSSHLLEKDGIWGMLAWLSVMYHLRMSVQSILQHHWLTHGRYFTAKMVYENIKKKAFNSLVDYVTFLTNHDWFVGSQHGRKPFVYTVLSSQNFKYSDPIDGVVRSCGIKVELHPNSRIIYRLVVEKTNRFRIYLESYSTDPGDFAAEAVAFLAPLAKFAIELSNIPGFLKDYRPSYMV